MTVLFFQGLAGSGPGHWQRHWVEALDDARFVEQRDFDRPDLEDWLARAVAAIEAAPDAVLVGHSLGAVLIAHLAARRPDLPVRGALLVAPADVEEAAARAPAIAGFGPLPQAALPFPAIVVGSRNDPYMRWERTRQFASLWDAKLIDLGNAGHINVASGHGPWPEGRLFVDLLAGRHPKPFLIASRDVPSRAATRGFAARSRKA